MSEPARGQGRIRDLFLRCLGLVFCSAFLSLYVQVTLLVGREGLLPAARWLEALRRAGAAWTAPTVFWLDASDAALRGVAITGAVASLGLVLGLAPRGCLAVCWLLYLSFVNVGQDFLSFQWDNLLLESGLFALLVTPGGLRPRHAPAPHPLAAFLVRWLVFRLGFESGAAKLLTGDPTWRSLTAMVSYYETAPLPTWIGWWAHQMPLAGHQAAAVYTLIVELALTPLLFGPRPIRLLVFGATVAMQVMIVLTANYGFFNYLSIALALWMLDDGHLRRAVERCGGTLAPAAPHAAGTWRTGTLAALVVVVVPLSLVPFLPFVRGLEPVSHALAPVRRGLDAVRSLNAYHLFAHMTLVRDEAIIEASDDGASWMPYEFRWKPGDPDRTPAFVAPHQPRVDFQLWFLLLGGPPRGRYFDTLLARLLEDPRAVAPLFARDPFPERPPRWVRLAVWRYRFTDVATRRATGAWWLREPRGVSRPLAARDLAPR